MVKRIFELLQTGALYLCLIGGFYLILTPIGFVIRCMGLDPLKINKRPTPSYWRPVKHPIDNS